MSKFTEDAELREHLTFKMQTCSRLFFFRGGTSVRLMRDRNTSDNDVYMQIEATLFCFFSSVTVCNLRAELYQGLIND